MKKLWFALLALLLLCSCGADNTADGPAAPEAPGQAVTASTTDTAGETLKETPVADTAQQQSPPALTVVCEDTALCSMGGSYSWWYDNDDGSRCGAEADSLHPLDAQEHLPMLAMTGAHAQLQFDGEAPDAVSVRCWSTDHWGNTSAEGSVTTVADLTFPLQNEACVYEVIATWSRFDTWGGTASYMFYTAPMGVELHVDHVSAAGLTEIWEQGGCASDGELQLSCQFWLEQRTDGHWETVAYSDALPDWGWRDEALILETGGALQLQTLWDTPYGQLPNGEYRLGREVTAVDGSDAPPCWTVWSAPFVINS